MHQRRTKTTRYVIWSDKPISRLLPIALLGLLLIFLPLIFLLFVFAKNNIEANTRSSVKQTLLKAGLTEIEVLADGQFVSLVSPGSQEEADRALTLAQQSKANTLFGPLSAPISVEVDFKPAASQAETQSEVVTPASNNQTSPESLHWGNIVNTLNNGLLTIKGQVGNPSEKRALIQHAKNKLHISHIKQLEHKLEVSPGSVEGALELAMLSTAMLSHCTSGESSTTEGILALTCNTTPEGASAIEKLKSQAISESSFGTFKIDITETCAARFRSAFKVTKVHFDNGSSALPPSSTSKFDKLAKQMRNCPQLLRIDGHTDDSGDQEFNKILSFKRAMAIVEALADRGVERKFLIPYAFASEKPHSSEATETAKASNRRIEIHLFNQGDH